MAALGEIKMRLKGIASEEAFTIVTRTRLRALRRLGEHRCVITAGTGVGKCSVGQNRKIRGCGRRRRWNNRRRRRAKPC
jgi:hypothetical protein